MIHPLALAFLKARAAQNLCDLADEAADRITSAAEEHAYMAWAEAGSPVYAEPPPNTVRVRIAVSVSPDGRWAAKGGSSNNANALNDCDHEAGDRASWITADCPMPEPATEIAGEVSGE